MLSERLALLVSLDAQGAVRGLESVGRAADRNLGRAESKLDRMGSRFQKAGTGMLATAGLLGAGLYKAGQAAADLEQAVGGTEAVFKDASGFIDRFAKSAAKNMGLSERAFREGTTALGGQLKGLGFDLDEAAEKSVDLVKIASDLAATYGGTTAEAVQALGAAFRGEADPAERFNLFLNQTRVNAKAVEMGLASSTSAVDAHAKAQATLALILEQSADAQGQFSREMGTASGQMQIASAEIENAKAAFGESVAPIMADFAGGLASVARGISDVNESTGGLLSKVATFGTVGLGAAGGLSFVVGKAIELRGAIKDLPRRIQTLGSNFGGLATRSAVLAGQIGALYTAVQLLGGAADHADLTDLERSLFDLSKGGQIEGLAVDVGDVGRAVERLAAPSVASQVDHFASSFLRAMGNTDDQLSQARATIDDLDKSLASLASKNPEAAAAALDAIVKSLPPEAGERLVGLLDEYDSTLGQIEITSEATASSTDGLAASTEDLAEKSKNAEEAQRGLIDAIKEQFDEITSGLEAQIDWQAAIDDLTEGLKENGRTLDISTEKGRKNAQNLLDTKDALVGLIEQRFEETGSLRAATQAGEFYLEGLKQQLRAAGFTEEQVAELVAQYGLVPREVATRVSAETSQANSALDTVLSKLRTVAGGAQFTVLGGSSLARELKGATGGLVPQGLTPIRRAAGGPVGTDTVPAWLTPGEFVVSRAGVMRAGLAALTALNSGPAPARGRDTIVIPVSIGGREVERLIVDAQSRTVRRGFA